jgi:hypothetical protein
MAITEAYSGSVATSATEYSLPNTANYNIANGLAVAGVYQVFLDLNGLAVGNNVRIRIYEKCRAADTQRVIYESNIIGTGTPTWVSPSLVLLNAWDVTVLGVSGTPTITWSIRKVA